MKYRIAWHIDIRGLESFVNELIELGWKPLGGLVVLPRVKESDKNVFLQTLIMEEK